MPNRLSLFCRSIIFSFLLVLAFSTAQARADESVPAADGCTTEMALHVCVTSAAITQGPSAFQSRDRIGATVSITMKIKNTSDYPINVAFMRSGQTGWALAPQNAQAFVSGGDWNVSGLQVCRDIDRCQFTTIAAGGSALTQISYIGRIARKGLPLVQAALTASFATSLYVEERGENRLVSLTLDGFNYGNSLSE